MNYKIYQNTIIRWEIISFFYLFGGFIFFIFINKLKKISTWNNITNFVFCIAVIGSFLTFSVLGMNFFFSNKLMIKENYKIQEKKQAIGPKYNRNKKSPIAIIEIKNSYQKEIKFELDQTENLKKANFVELDLSEGLFNFPIIRNKKLKN